MRRVVLPFLTVLGLASSPAFAAGEALLFDCEINDFRDGRSMGKVNVQLVYSTAMGGDLSDILLIDKGGFFGDAGVSAVPETGTADPANATVAHLPEWEGRTANLIYRLSYRPDDRENAVLIEMTRGPNAVGIYNMLWQIGTQQSAIRNGKLDKPVQTGAGQCRPGELPNGGAS